VTPASATSRSPFALLRDAEQAEEVLILTYTASLEFFERFTLGEARGLQAATTVISDAAMVTVDPVTVRGAGMRYVEARAVCPGRTAFHPKLLVVAGRERTTIAIGSGNLTLAGWHGNDELWTVVHADAARGPTTLRAVSSFLRALADGPIQLSAAAPGALHRTAEILDGLPADETGPELVSTLDGPIIDRLPQGPVDELVVYAPFHDAALDALTALHTRLQPARTTVCVQAQTSVDGEALRRWLNDHDGHLSWCSDERYRHGKLIEWSRDGTREALTGSPNLSGPALLRGLTAAGGPPANCELGTISRIDGPLKPPEAKPPATGLAGLTFARDPADAPRPGLLLLGATLIDGVEINLRLAAPLTAAARVQAHDPDRDWTTVPGIGELPTGERDYRLPAIGLPAGQALRLLGAQGASNEVFVADPIRARRRPVRRIGPEAGTPVELLLDGKLAVLYEIAELMRPALLQFGAMVPKPAPRPGGPQDGKGKLPDAEGRMQPAKGQSLADYLAACAAALDEASVEWALALPALPGLGGDDGLDRKTGLLTSETGDAAADAGEDEGDAPPLDFPTAVRRATATRRNQLRRFSERVLGRVHSWPNVMRAYAARLVLNAAAANLWPDEQERGDVLVRLIQALTAPGDDPTPEEAAASASYLAISVAMLRSDVRRLSVRDEATLRFETAAASARPRLDDVDPERLDTLAAELEDGLGAYASPERVFDLAAEIQIPLSGIAAAVALLRDEDGIDSAEQDGTLLVKDPLPIIAERELLRIAGMVGGPGPLAVRGVTAVGAEVFCIWDAPQLVIARRTRAGLGGRLYRVPTSSPGTIAAGWQPALDVRDNMPNPTANWFPGRPPPKDALELLRTVGAAA
jgi:hypothetical protein